MISNLGRFSEEQFWNTKEQAEGRFALTLIDLVMLSSV